MSGAKVEMKARTLLMSIHPCPSVLPYKQISALPWAIKGAVSATGVSPR
jgi:hypothetical protein